jgi:nucleoside-diphosphate-sugar epimerase
MLNHFNQKKILITGCTGCLGAFLLRELLSANALIWVTQYQSKIDNTDVKVIPMDKLWQNGLPEFDYVFHLAAKVDVKDELTKEELDISNVTFTKLLIERLTFKKFIFASTVSVFSLSNKLITESSTIAPQNSYATTKWEAEKLVMNLPQYSIMRFSSIYGEGMKTDTFLPIMIQHAIRENKMKVFGQGSRLQNYIPVSQSVNFLMYGAIKTENYVGLAVSNNEYSNLAIAEEIAKLTNANIVMEGEDLSPSFQYDNQNTLKELALASKETTLANDIKSLITWLRNTRY